MVWSAKNIQKYINKYIKQVWSVEMFLFGDVTTHNTRRRSCEYKVIANKFGVHKTTVKKFVYSFCKWMVSSVINHLIKVPTAKDARAIARRFEEKFCIPQVVGCIDRTHIPVLPPSDGFKHFVNRKRWPSYVLQAVADDMCRWAIVCVWYSSHVSCREQEVLQRNLDLKAKTHQKYCRSSRSTQTFILCCLKQLRGCINLERNLMNCLAQGHKY